MPSYMMSLARSTLSRRTGVLHNKSLPRRSNSIPRCRLRICIWDLPMQAQEGLMD